MPILKHPFRLIQLGRPHSGKTTQTKRLLTKGFLPKFDAIFLIIESDDIDYYDFLDLPHEHIYPKYTEKTLKKITELVNMYKAASPTGRCKHLIIFEDTGAGAIRGHNYQNALDQSMFNLRHSDRSILMNLQMVKSASVPTRFCADGAILYACHNDSEVKKIHPDFGVGDETWFKKFWRHHTREDYSFLFIHRQGPRIRIFKKFEEKLWDSSVDSYSDEEKSKSKPKVKPATAKLISKNKKK